MQQKTSRLLKMAIAAINHLDEGRPNETALAVCAVLAGFLGAARRQRCALEQDTFGFDGDPVRRDYLNRLLTRVQRSAQAFDL